MFLSFPGNDDHRSKPAFHCFMEIFLLLCKCYSYFSHFQNADWGKKNCSLERLLAFRASLMSSFRWPLNCFNCTFSSFGVEACSPSWEKKKKEEKRQGGGANASRNSSVSVFPWCSRAPTLAPTVRQSPKEAACYCPTASIKQETWRHPLARAA